MTVKLHSIILCGELNQFVVVPFDPAHDTIYRHHDRRKVDAECRWMNSIVAAVECLEDTDLRAISPHTGRPFCVSGPVSETERIAISILVKSASSNI